MFPRPFLSFHIHGCTDSHTHTRVSSSFASDSPHTPRPGHVQCRLPMTAVSTHSARNRLQPLDLTPTGAMCVVERVACLVHRQRGRRALMW